MSTMNLAIKSKDEELHTMHQKVTDLMNEIETQKELFAANASTNDPETLINLRKTTERLSDLLLENERLKRQHSSDLQDLKLQLQEAEVKRDSFEEQLTAYQNQDRAIREKCTVLEVQNKKLEKVITEKEYETLKQEKIAKE